VLLCKIFWKDENNKFFGVLIPNLISREHSLIKSNYQRVLNLGKIKYIINILVEEFRNQMNIKYNLGNG